MAHEPKKDLDARIAERTESMLDRLNRKIQRTLDELRAQGSENGPSIEDEFEGGGSHRMTEAEWEKWWADPAHNRRRKPR